MRILYVVPNVPSRVRVRPFNLIRRLSREHEVSVLCIATSDVDRLSVEELRRCCKSVEVFNLSRWRSLWNCIVAVFSTRALRTAYFYSPDVRERVKEIVGRNDIDLVHAEHLKTVPLVAPVSGRVPTVFDAVDCVSLMEARRRRVLRSGLLRLFSWWEEMKMGRSEAWAAGRFDAIVISSPVDKQAYPLRGDTKRAIQVVPNCVDLEYFGFQQFEPQQNAVIFCANLAYFPNQDAVHYLSQYIWPILRARRPDLQLDIVGSRPPLRIRDLDGKENIRVFASVPDVRPYLGRAWIALCPVRVQAGTQNKILEAMALGVPVVATPECCTGLAVQPGKDLLAADTPDEFVSAIELLLDDRIMRNDLVRAGRGYVETHHHWDRSAEKLLATYREVLGDSVATMRCSASGARGLDAAGSSGASLGIRT